MRKSNLSETIYLEFDDFKDGHVIENRIGVNFEHLDELECLLSCTISGGAKQTYWQPAESPECDDVKITCVVDDRSFEISGYLTDKARDNYVDQVIENNVDYEQDAKDAADEARWEAQRDER